MPHLRYLLIVVSLIFGSASAGMAQPASTWDLKNASSSILVRSNCINAGQNGTLLQEIPASGDSPRVSLFLFDGYIFALSLMDIQGDQPKFHCTALEIDPYSLEKSE